MLASAVAAGLCSAGIDVVTMGIAPTPAVSFAARTSDFGLGVIISASHNPAPDNGIKFVGHDGRKLTDETELHIESLMGQDFDRPTGAAVGCVSEDRTPIAEYMDMLESIVPERLEGLTVSVDGAHGAAFELGPAILRRLGATVFELGNHPDGLNINADGGATKPETVQEHTLAHGSHVGVSFDGDADRVVFSDDKGRLINGDRTIGIWAAHKQRRNELEPPIVIGTVMSNGGFEKYMTESGINLVRTPVGDKYVAQQLVATGALVGGEQSGHIIFPLRGPTGDGLVTMLEFLRVLVVDKRASSAFFEDYDPWPQLMVNVAVESTADWSTKPNIARALAHAEENLAGHGRLVVRPSGTQPVIRVMVEADSYDLRDRCAEEIVKAMEADLNGIVHGRVDLTHALGD